MTFEVGHPYWHVRSVLEKEPNIEALSLSYYVYRPQSLVDERTTFSLSRQEFLDPSTTWNVINSCPPDQDVALHSNVRCSDGQSRHLPMADMSTPSKAHLQKLKSFLDNETFYGFVWFESGRSFHGYGSRFINDHEWITYMGQLLLSNQKDLKPTVDPRWIGHRLIAGYAALRWTRNTYHYLRLPSQLPPF